MHGGEHLRIAIPDVVLDPLSIPLLPTNLCLDDLSLRRKDLHLRRQCVQLRQTRGDLSFLGKHSSEVGIRYRAQDSADKAADSYPPFHRVIFSFAAPS